MSLPARRKKRARRRRSPRHQLSRQAAAPQRGLFQRGTNWSAEQQWEFNRQIATALIEAVRSCQATIANQEARIANVAGEIAAVFSMTERLHELQHRLQALEDRVDGEHEAALSQARRIEDVGARVEKVQERVSEELETAHARQEASEAASQEAMRGHTAATAQQLDEIRNEIRDRIQHLLDEQRVCIRQLSLQTTEEAVLADRARRATELRLEELARRLQQLPPPA